MTRPDFVLTDVQVPTCLLVDPDRFGGKPEGGFRRGDLLIRQGRVAGLGHWPDLPRIEGRGRILLPALSDPHVHLDKCHTAHRLPGIGGDLVAAIAAQGRDKARWTETDIRARAERGLEELCAAGVTRVRSHVDWGTGTDPAAVPLAWPVMVDLARDWSDRIDLQLSALIDTPVLADPDTARGIAARIARDGGVLGLFVSLQPDRATAIAAAVDLADSFGLPLDFHVDEGLEPGMNGLSLIAEAMLQHRHLGPVLCGHASSLANLAGADLAATLDKVARAGISVVSLPTTNLYLQHRVTGATPDRRGITRLHELADAGVNVALGCDNVRDAFFPLGTHDLLAILGLAVPALHLDPPFERWLPLVTTNAARAMGAAPVEIDRAGVADLILTEASNMADLLATPGRSRLSSLTPG
ncbi:amidohydrolase family protein [Tabrizicola sp. J26]|uniref:amidohydrolase family protein n=1 Tax=Alitabrizicola rongguiensis TaxID=2909234 RepID=UPI001F4185E6|nr:amidohydrolase family protein [Tabrizicola rongguiensis]MCF1710362.1 amidohydrolase family protein [Tabrizicola rongguiensis]